MKWKSDKKVVNPKKGDEKQKTRFAILPTKVDGNWILFEKYSSIYVYKLHLVYSEQFIERGIFTERVRGNYSQALGWVFSHRTQTSKN